MTEDEKFKMLKMFKVFSYMDLVSVNCFVGVLCGVTYMVNMFCTNYPGTV